MSAGIVSGQLLICSLAGYAFARLRFPGRDRLFLLFLAHLMVPVIVLLIPRFLIVSLAGGVDTYWGLIVPELVSVYGIFLMRQFFITLPGDLEDAARIDGASEFQIWWRIILPLSKHALATLGVFAFVSTWQSFLWPLIVTRSLAMRPVEVGIASFHGAFESNWPFQMAAAVTAVLPLVLVFFFTQRYFTRGIALTGLKG
jgi:multiple sugar transport system permease protein